jgi:hypothetical protein
MGWIAKEPEKSCTVRARKAGMGEAGIEMPLARKDRLRSDGSAQAKYETSEGSTEAGSETISDQHAMQDGVASPQYRRRRGT